MHIASLFTSKAHLQITFLFIWIDNGATPLLSLIVRCPCSLKLVFAFIRACTFKLLSNCRKTTYVTVCLVPHGPSVKETPQKKLKGSAIMNDSREERDNLRITVNNEFNESAQDDELDFSEEKSGEGEEVTLDTGDESEILNDTDLDDEITKALEEGDQERAQELLDEKESRCEQLKDRVKQEQETKKQQLQRMKNRFKSLKKRTEALNSSLARSRTSTPNNSPKNSPTARGEDQGGLTALAERQQEGKMQPKENNQPEDQKATVPRKEVSMTPSFLLY